MNLHSFKAQCCKALGIPTDTPFKMLPTILHELVLRAEKAESTVEGYQGALTLLYPPRVGPHTEAAYIRHSEYYHGSTKAYRCAADEVSLALEAHNDRIREFVNDEDPQTGERIPIWDAVWRLADEGAQTLDQLAARDVEVAELKRKLERYHLALLAADQDMEGQLAAAADAQEMAGMLRDSCDDNPASSDALCVACENECPVKRWARAGLEG